MKSFNLEEALRGRAVVTRSGKPVFQLTRFYQTESNYPLHGVVDKQVVTWTDEGKYHPDSGDTSFDLMFEPIIKTGWVARYEREGTINNSYVVDRNIYTSEAEAQNCCPSAVGYHEISWEE